MEKKLLLVLLLTSQQLISRLLPCNVAFLIPRRPGIRPFLLKQLARHFYENAMRCKKIIIGFGSSMYSEHVVDFTLRYLVQPGMLLVGALITDLQGLQEQENVNAAAPAVSPGQMQKKVNGGKNKMYLYLQEQCKDNGAKAVIHQDSGCTLEALMQETRYADLLVLSQDIYLAATQGPYARPVSRVLEQCCCPVLVLPSQQARLEQVVMTFDGSIRAMDGIKQFAYLLGGMTQQLPVTVLTTYGDTQELPAAEEKLFIEYLKQHFSNVGLHRLNEGAEHTIKSAIGLNEHVLAVVNVPSSKSLPLLHKLLHGTATLHAPLRPFAQGTKDTQEELVNA